MSDTDLLNFSWLIAGQLAGMACPRAEEALAALSARGVRAVISLTEESLPAALLERHGLQAVHLPLADFTAPTTEQADAAVAAIDRFLADGRPVAVHCAAGLGRTGTILACYLVSRGASASEAIVEIRARRSGSIETKEQEAAVETYARYRRERAERDDA